MAGERLIPRTIEGQIVYTSQKGSIEVISGCMFSGKSEEEVRRIKRAAYGKENVQVFKPQIDNRYNPNAVSSHNGDCFSATLVDHEHPEQILYKLNGMASVVAIDEGQFFGKELINVAKELADQGVRVIIAGLDTDFRGEPFGPIPALIAIAEKHDKLHAICMICGDEANRTQRLVNGQPANYNNPIIMVGAQEAYEARCRHCHEVPGRPNNI